jgi:hypothetical protein
MCYVEKGSMLIRFELNYKNEDDPCDIEIAPAFAIADI